jgi:hypothetical protein
MEKCSLCEKDRKNFNRLVWYSGSLSAYLCRSCYSKWTHNKKCKELKEKYKDAKPCTKQWSKMCSEQQKAFDKWFYANGGKDE